MILIRKKEFKMKKNIKMIAMLFAMISVTMLSAGSALAGKGMGHGNMAKVASRVWEMLIALVSIM